MMDLHETTVAPQTGALPMAAPPPFSQIVQQVQRQTAACETEAAEAVQITLQTLGERLSPAQKRMLAAQLPAEAIRALGPDNPQERFTLNQFYERIAVRAGADLPAAVAQVRAVIAALETTLGESELAALKTHLPRQFRELFSSTEAS